MLKPHLFLFTIGPVQSFIAQARKTQDLYAGSKILGELILVAAGIAEKNGIEFIFPNKIEKGLPIPNRFLGKIKEKTAEELRDIGHKIERRVRQKFWELAEDAIGVARISDVDRDKIKKAFRQQIEHHLVINWLFHPLLGEDDASYRVAYQEIEALMGSIKNVRIFEQYDYNLDENWGNNQELVFSDKNYPGEAGRKCSLDGERNALVFGYGTEGRYSAQGVILKESLVQVEANEGLSAVGLLKRFFKDNNNVKFPSTAEIAIFNTIKDKKKYEIYKACLGEREWDAQLCFKENLTEKYLRKNGYGDVLKRANGLETLLNCWKTVFEGKQISSYYALVAFDGDKMGEILSGDPKFFKGGDLQEYQGKVSQLLSSFAREVEKYFKVEKYAGAVAYTGGDDFLGFVNLESLFEVMGWLRREFHNQVSDKLTKAGYFVDGYDFTFSAGIAVAHYKMPLSMVLDKARAMEKFAKSPKAGDRDSFAISVIKKSGESHETCYKWKRGQDLVHWQAIDRLVGYFEDGYCSETFARSFTREFYTLQDDDGYIKDNGMVRMELARLVKRAMTDKGNKTKGKMEEILQTLDNLIMVGGNGGKGNFEFQNLSEAISIALFLKRNRKKQIKNGNQINQ